MNVLRSSLLALSLAVGASTVAFAQAATAPPPAHAGHHHNPAHEARHLSKMLGLSPDQTAQLQPILAERRQKMAALRTSNDDAKTMHRQRRAIMEDSTAKLNAILTPAQQQQFATMRAAHHHGHGQQATAPPAA